MGLLDESRTYESAGTDRPFLSAGFSLDAKT
jgi:hypothetical protein